MKPLSPTIFVVDDDSSVREALSNLLRSHGLNVQTFDNAQAFLDQPRPDCPSCLVLDMRMPGMTGIELQQHLLALSDFIPTIFISAHGDIPVAVRAVKAGAIEFLPKPFEEQALLSAIEQGLALDQVRRQHLAQRVSVQSRFEPLTNREWEVLKLTVKGLLNKQIGGELGIAEVTVKVHRHNMMQKLEVRSLPDLIRLVEEYYDSKN
ncbi:MULTISPECIES: response regulator transcription factor [Pseudomonas]|uniref:Response regulator n=1 Tax=Pseudomonas lactis TaxID=1615674 RepID=A0A921TBT9_9PSED|nr:MULTISPECIES: response regulator [Pseudomonas]QBQ10374.1 response regulator transcription factor [Pseudomonas sp. SXM-1]HJH22877.1 response regulator [Pseudomonas lactis]